MNREPEILRLDRKSPWVERYLERAEQRGSMHGMTRAARFLQASLQENHGHIIL